jgi:acetoin utilization deacetylase AcuC-like enzyme
MTHSTLPLELRSPAKARLSRRLLRALRARAGRLIGRRELAVFHHSRYRLPLSGLELAMSIEPRRAELAVWSLRHLGALSPEGLHTPEPVSYGQLSLVHTDEYLDSLSRPEVLARIFAAEPSEIAPDELLLAVRLACGGTVEGARLALAKGAAVLNTLGGFHHAGRGRGGGLCALNDVAVAVAVLREEGFTGRIVVLDLDAHPPDGTADCLRPFDNVSIGSLSGSNWGQLQGVDAMVLPEGCTDGEYLRALDLLLTRMPRPELAFVNAGGDVLAGDRFGLLGLSLDGVRQRDGRVARALGAGTASVWTPGGGYQPDAWRALVGTGLVLAGRANVRIPPDYDLLTSHFLDIAASRNLATRQDEPFLSQRELEDVVAKRLPSTPTLLGFSKEALEYALFRYGVAAYIERLGYRHLRVEIELVGEEDRIRVYGEAEGEEYLLIEAFVSRQRIGGEEYLFVNWLALRHPRAQFTPLRPRLPGQDVPGLGLAREISELFAIVAQRRGLRGVAFRPSWYHLAFAARQRARFLDVERQARFEALVRDMSKMSLLEATNAIAEGRVHMNGEAYQWEADNMVYRLADAPSADASARAVSGAYHFTVEPH